MSVDYGINSLSGFSFQIQVYIYFLSQIKENDYLEFETLEDIALIEKPYEVITDENSTSFKNIISLNENIKAIQVKRTEISNSNKIIYNWLLLLESNDIKKFILVISDEYSNVSNLFSKHIKTFYNEIITTKKGSNSLIGKVKKLYENDYELFKIKYNFIKANHEVEQIKKIEEKILENFNQAFHKFAVNENIYGLRVKSFCDRMTANIMNSINKRQPYRCNYIS